MTTQEQTASEILRQMAASILRDQENQVQDVRRQVRQCEQMIALAKKELTSDGPCIWFDLATRKCRHYEYRPALCRDGVLVDDAACRGWRVMKGIDLMPGGGA